MELAAGARVYLGPAVLAVVLETRDVGAEERSELAGATTATTLVTHLVVKYVWLHLDLPTDKETSEESYLYSRC